MTLFQTIDNFLLCCKLETGGRTIGCVKFVAGVALMVFCGTVIGRVGWKIGYDLGNKNVSNSVEGTPVIVKNLSVTEPVNPEHFTALLSFVAMLLSFWVVFSSYELIQGCRTVSLKD